MEEVLQSAATVRIIDYAEPQFTPDVAALMDAIAPMAADLRLETDAVMAEASEQSGLDDFGEPSFRDRLDVLLHGLRDEVELSPFGVLGNHSLVVQLLKNRLLFEDVWRRHPEIADERVERPIIICGLPRTGTTHLHNLISADPALRSLPYWESLEPIAVPDEEPDGRRARTELAVDTVNAVMPLFPRMHEMTVDHVHEEIQLLAIDFSSMLFETMGPMPSWHDWYRDHDQTPHYRYLYRVLQALQWLRGPKRWVLKSPQHLEQFGPLRTVFPDATFVVTHRDPVAVVASMITMLAYTARMTIARPDPKAYGAYWMPRLERMLRACARDHEQLPANQTIDVHFDAFMADDVAMVERIYTIAGQPMTDDVRRAMDAFMETHPRGRHGGIAYDLAQLGIDPDERRKALQFYVDRFDIDVER
ncbi:MAG: hypothetical protein QOJ09_1284 [Actinomycetota bacterium]|nr:hypothetical protein [Actinomycetota bacterium]